MKSLAFFFILLLIPLASALDTCTDTNEFNFDDIPCQGVTTVLDCSANVTVINLNDTNQFNLTTENIGNNQYNFTWNFSDEASYSVVDCANNSATILVGDFPRGSMWKFSMVLGYIGIAIVFILISMLVLKKEKWVLKSFLYIAAILTLLIAINSAGIASVRDNISSLMEVGVVVTVTLISIFVAYMFIFMMISLAKSLREARNERKSEQ